MNTSDILDILVEEIQECVPELIDKPITAESSMVEIGINSMERAEILIATLEAIDLAVPMTTLHGPKNLGELATLLHEKKAER